MQRIIAIYGNITREIFGFNHVFYIKINKLFTNPRESAVQDGAFVALPKKYNIKKDPCQGSSDLFGFLGLSFLSDIVFLLKSPFTFIFIS